MNVELTKYIISTYFRNNNLSLQKLPQVYILYRALQKIGKSPTLVKGYLVNHLIQLYHIYFWIICDGQMHNIIDETLCYSYDPNIELIDILPEEIEMKYINMDPDPTAVQNSFNACLNDTFLEHLFQITSTNIYNQIRKCYLDLVS